MPEKEDIAAIPAGREMDALVAERVMGRSICEHSRIRSVAQGGGFAMCGDQTCKGELHYEFLPRYSTDIVAAWEVVEKARLCVSPFKSYGWVVSGGQQLEEYNLEPRFVHSVVRAIGETAPLAICRAALRAVTS